MKAAGYDGIELCGFMIHPIGFMVKLLTKAGMPVGKGGNLDWHKLWSGSGPSGRQSAHRSWAVWNGMPTQWPTKPKASAQSMWSSPGCIALITAMKPLCTSLPQRLNKAGETLKAEGVELLYHNHNCELRHVNAEKRAYDILLEETDPHLSTLSLTATGSPRAAQTPLRGCSGLEPA